MGNCPPCKSDVRNNISNSNTISQPVQLNRDVIKTEQHHKGLTSFENDILNYHNRARTENGLEPLVWNKKLSQYAKDWGMFLKDNEECKIRHPINSKQEQDRYIPNNTGQNLYYSQVEFGGLDDKMTKQLYEGRKPAKGSTQAWYDEHKIYQPPPPGQGLPNNFLGVGHMTQLLWKDAKEVGCYSVDCSNKVKAGNVGYGDMVVCNYDKGNVSNQFREKVPYPVKNLKL
jgi:hypothetical protein